MNNIRIAKELTKIAKSLIAEEQKEQVQEQKEQVQEQNKIEQIFNNFVHSGMKIVTHKPNQLIMQFKLKDASQCKYNIELKDQGQAIIGSIKFKRILQNDFDKFRTELYQPVMFDYQDLKGNVEQVSQQINKFINKASNY